MSGAPRTYALWDTTQADHQDVFEGAEAERLCGARVGPFEEMVRAKVMNVPESGAGSALDARSRLKVWSSARRIGPNEVPNSMESSWWDYVDIYHLTAGLGSLLYWLAVWIVGLLVGPFVWMLWRGFLSKAEGRRKACQRALVKRRCPDCHYNLRELPDGVPAHLLEGAAIGPRRCPECGVPWPLLPPKLVP